MRPSWSRNVDSVESRLIEERQPRKERAERKAAKASRTRGALLVNPELFSVVQLVSLEWESCDLGGTGRTLFGIVSSPRPAGSSSCYHSCHRASCPIPLRSVLFCVNPLPTTHSIDSVSAARHTSVLFARQRDHLLLRITH